MNEVKESKRGKDEAAMMYVSEGAFLMGSDFGNADERPQREVALDASGSTNTA